MDIETITYDNYTFKIEPDTNQIKVNMTDNTLMEIYEGTVKEDDLYVKPIKKFYSMIIRALNKEQNFTFSIDNRNSKMVCTVSYSTDMVDLEEHIILNKISASESRELLLIRRVHELEDLLTPVFGYKYDDEVGLKYLKFDLNSKVLDFRPFNQSLNENNTIDLYRMNELFITEFNKFKNVTEIIFDAILSPVYYTSTTLNINSIITDINITKYIYYKNYGHPHHINNIFDNEQIYLPSVTEIKIYILSETKNMLQKINNTQPNQPCAINPFGNLRSLPNLKKIYIINTGGIQVDFCIHGLINKSPSHTVQQAINHGWKKNLKHFVFKNINLSKDQTDLATNCNVKLEYIS